MEYLIVSAVALAVAALTLFSGFGLGTLLLPAFALFFPVDVAVAATAVVHLANNLFKVGLVGRGAHGPTVVRFGLPAVLLAPVGALILAGTAQAAPLIQYDLGGRVFAVTALKLLIAAVVGAFAAAELSSRFQSLALPPRYIPLGGALSGFFGGLSGHQGALRTAFLARAGLGKEAFIGTMVVCAVLVDVSRLAVYGSTVLPAHLGSLRQGSGLSLVAVATLAAFAGSFAGSRLLRKVAVHTVQILVGVLLLVFSVALGAGLL
ncbi:MAG: TSUP family transporter [Deferrisomatales bacterium]